MIQIYAVICSKNRLIYDLFERYPLGQVITSTVAEKWPGNNPWIISALETGVQGLEDFEFYTENDILNTLNNQNGVAFNSAWISATLPTGVKDTDYFESYTPSSNLNGLSDGTGWNGSWISIGF